MDLWDITRLIFRRWYFALPPLLLTILGVMFVSTKVSPDYKATGHLQLVPPAHRDPEAIRTGRVGNPWLDLGIQPLGQAALIKVQDARFVRQLTAEGYSENIVITIDYPSTYLSIEVTGSSPAQATGTVKRVMQLLIEDVRAEQEQFKVAPDDLITTVSLDQGEKVTPVNGKVKRTLIAAGGVGLLLTAVFTVGLDALVRRRGRRKAARRGGEADEPDPDPGRSALAIPAPRIGRAVRARESEAEATARFSRPLIPAVSSGAGKVFQSRSVVEPVQAADKPIVDWHPQRAVQTLDDAVMEGAVVDVNDSEKTQTLPSGATVPPETAGPSEEIFASDATIVLPVITTHSVARPGGNEQH